MKISNFTLSHGRALAAISIIAILATAQTALADTFSDDAASWLISEQVSTGPTTGAFPWTAGETAVYANTQGATALSLLRVYERTGNSAHLAAAVANGDCMVNDCITGMTFTDGDHKFGSHNALFLVELSRLSGDPQYANFVTSGLWDKFTAGTYGEDNDQDVAAYLAALFVSRASIPELAAWDVSKLAIGAFEAGQNDIVTAIMGAVLQSLELSDASHTTYDIIGLAGAVWASAKTGIDLDPTSGKWAAADSTSELAELLTAYQAPGGGFITSSVSAVDNANISAQTTAFAMQALASVDPVLYDDVIVDGFASIVLAQAGSGQILAIPGANPVGNGTVETHGESLEAYASIVLRPQDVYVDDDYAGASFGDAESFTHPQVNGGSAMAVVVGQDAFASITEALDQVAIGGNVYVAEGTYVEGSVANDQNLLIGLPVQLIGAQAGIDARNRSDVGASIIQPAVANPGLTYASVGAQVIVQIVSDNITLEGFVLDGDNPALTSGVDMNGADPDVDAGIFATGSHIDISTNVIRNLVYAGIYNYNYPASTPAGVGNVIYQNWIHNIDAPSNWGIGIGVLWNYYADINENLLDDVRVGIQTNYFFKPTTDPANDARIRNNEVNASALSIYHNYQDGLGGAIASPWTIENNTLSAVNNPAQDGLWIGLALQGIHDGIANIQNNMIDGSNLAAGNRLSAGYRVNLITTDQASNISITGGMVSNVDYGVLATDGGFYEGALENTNIAGVAFDNVAMAAFYVEDTALAGAETTDFVPKITIGAGNSYNNVAYEAVLSGPQASIDFVAGTPLFNTVFVRAANDGHRPGEVDSGGNIRHVENAIINNGIAIAASGGTVGVEAGQFDQNVVINKSVFLSGPFAGTSGDDASRTGVGEAIISPTSGQGVRINADNVSFDGFTISGTTGLSVVSGGYANGQVLNNRIVDSTASGLYIENSIVASNNWLIQNNLFDNLNGGSATAIILVNADGAQVLDNVLSNISYQGLQFNNVTNSDILRNVISGVQRDGINLYESSDLLISNNTFADINQADLADRGSIRLYDTSTDIDVSCNVIDAERGGIALRTGIAGSLNLFHNRVTGSSVAGSRFVTSEWSGGIDIGSNWYDGTPAVTGTNAASVNIADALPADPTNDGAFDVAECGDNSLVAVVAYDGTPQSIVVDQAFSNGLQARVVDALGGAVSGETVEFAVIPLSSASASLAPASGVSDFNGVVSVDATANTVVGSYSVAADTATATGTPASFDLTNLVAAFDSIVIDSGDGQVGVAGLSLDDPLVVKAVDEFFNPVAGIAIGFAVTAGDGTINGASTVTDVDGLASSGDWTLGRDATVTQGIEASVTGMTGISPVSFTATGAEQADIAISMANTNPTIEAGDEIEYVLSITNNGPSHAGAVGIDHALPAELNHVTAQWICLGTGGATCPTTTGTSHLSLSGHGLPVGGAVTILLTVTVQPDTPDGVFSNSAMVTLTSGLDTAPANDIIDWEFEVITIIGEIFKDSFEDAP